MNKQMLLAQRQYFDMVHGVTLKVIGTFADEELDFRPQPGMRAPRELILHIYGGEKAMAEAVQHGRLTAEALNLFTPESEAGAAALRELDTVGDAQNYARACHQAANEALAAITDDDLARSVESPFGTFPGWQYFTFAYDEHWHHRGQLCTYLRLLGKQPPILYSYYEDSPA